MSEFHSAGRRVSHFRIVEKIGEGGMGVVYKAEDVDLKRSVALKFITRKPADDQVFRRFIREAQTAASLNHPDICTVYEVGQVPVGEGGPLGRGEVLEPGTPFIAMEYLEGETLRSLLARRGRLEPEAVVGIALPIADGLAAAHAKGVIHRDLKPSNVMLTQGGRVKVLDFGLAKSGDGTVLSGDDRSSADTASVALTSAGLIVGTAGYMSPEQALGGAVDSRSDVFSFGVMLYEMVAGEPAFRGHSRESIIAKIIAADPDPIESTNSDVPAELGRIIWRCLRKRPEERFNDTRDLVVALRDLASQLTRARESAFWMQGDQPSLGATPPHTPDRRASGRARRVRGRVVFAVTGMLLVVGGFEAGRQWGGGGAGQDRRSHRRITYSGSAHLPTVSPDGSFVAHAVKRAEGGVSVRIRDLAGGAPLDIFQADWVDTLEWSPSGAELLVSWRGSGGEHGGEAGMSIVPRLGGTPMWLPYEPLADWSPSGEQIVSTGGLIQEVTVLDRPSASSRSLRLPDEIVGVKKIDWSPGQRVLVLGSDLDGRSVIWTVDAATGDVAKLLTSRDEILSIHWAAEGTSVYFLVVAGDTNDLRRIPVDQATGRPAGTAQNVVTGTHAVEFSLPMRPHRLVLQDEVVRSNLWLVDVENGGETGGSTRTQLTTGSQFDDSPRFSPDGRMAAFTRGGSRHTSNVFVLSMRDGVARQITYLDCAAHRPVWSPDGAALAFTADCGAGNRLWSVTLSGAPARQFEHVEAGEEIAWSPGQKIAFAKPGNHGVSVVDPATGEEGPVIAGGETGWLFSPQYSPDDRLLAIAWNRSNGRGLWSLPLDGSVARPLNLGWFLPIRWSADGRWLYCRQGSDLFRIPSGGGDAEFVSHVPFEEATISDVSPDGGTVILADRRRSSDLWLMDNFELGSEEP